MEDLIYFNGVEVDTGEYFRQPLTLEQLRMRIKTPDVDAGGRQKALVDWADEDDLAQTGWGLIVHEHEDPAVLEALEPLLALRQEQAGRVRRFVFTEEDRLMGEEAIDHFFDRYGTPPGDVDPDAESLPYYLLIVGSPERIPFGFQAELDVTHASGRLYFDDVEGYANYTATLIRQERNPVRREKRLTFFGTNNGDRITALTSRFLVPPLAEKMGQVKPDDWAIETVSPECADKKTLTALLSGEAAPALLFTAGHGATSEKRPSELQGALITSDWQGAALSGDMIFTGADVEACRDYRGTIPFFFACFSAGTPAVDSFTQPGEQGLPWPKRPFVAQLVQALLGHERGPLAVIAHVDQAFQYSFLWNENILGIAHFAGTYSRLMKGKRLGWAMEPIRRRYAAALASINRARRRRKPNKKADLIRWISYQDARFYAVLGDPAIRLPL